MTKTSLNCLVISLIIVFSSYPLFTPALLVGSATLLIKKRRNTMTNFLKAAVRTPVGAVGKLSIENTAFLLCDIQDKFIPLISCSSTVVQTARLLTSVAKELKIPLIITEQYRKAFGSTYAQCFTDAEYLASLGSSTFEKKKFSMMTEEVTSLVDSHDVKSVVLFGIEAHVCLQQTCLDLLENGRDVHVVVDACSSMKLYDREIALYRMQSAGAFLTTAQSAVFMLLGSADHPNFKAISTLVKEHASLPNEFEDLLLKTKN